MNRNKHGRKRRRHVLRLWTLPQARAALPYLRSVVGSVREHALDVKQHRRRAAQLENRPGRQDRETIIALSDARAAAEVSAERFNHAMGELHAIDVYCLDPVRGEALIPFLHDNRLAWFVFEQFEEDPLRSWRFHDDDLEVRRPVADMLTDTTETSVIV